MARPGDGEWQQAEMVSSEPLLLPVSLEGEFSNSMKEMIGGCCVCSDERGWAENPLVYCDGHGCNVAVHQACYGIVQVPTGPWFCRKCESQERAARVGETKWGGILVKVGGAVPQNLGQEYLDAFSCASATTDEWETRLLRASGAASWKAID